MSDDEDGHTHRPQTDLFILRIPLSAEPSDHDELPIRTQIGGTAPRSGLPTSVLSVDRDSNYCTLSYHVCRVRNTPFYSSTTMHLRVKLQCVQWQWQWQKLR